MYPDYLVHYNKNHSKTNGQFVSGDGDGDGVTNDHANQKKQLTPEELKKKRAKRNAWIAVGAAAAGTAVAATALIITKNHSKKLADQAEKAKLGKSFVNATKISSTPLLEATAWSKQDSGYVNQYGKKYSRGALEKAMKIKDTAGNNMRGRYIFTQKEYDYASLRKDPWGGAKPLSKAAMNNINLLSDDLIKKMKRGK